jgi:hypothetical protein
VALGQEFVVFSAAQTQCHSNADSKKKNSLMLKLCPSSGGIKSMPSSIAQVHLHNCSGEQPQMVHPLANIDSVTSETKSGFILSLGPAAGCDQHFFSSKRGKWTTKLILCAWVMSPWVFLPARPMQM